MQFLYENNLFSCYLSVNRLLSGKRSRWIHVFHTIMDLRCRLTTCLAKRMAEDAIAAAHDSGVKIAAITALKN